MKLLYDNRPAMIFFSKQTSQKFLSLSSCDIVTPETRVTPFKKD